MTGSLRLTSLKLIVFTAVTIAITTWLAAIIGNFSVFGGSYEIKAEFADATGLLRGDVVKAAGVTVGRVEDISINGGMAVVTMSLSNGTEVPANVSAEVRFRNLVGQRMITLVQPPQDRSSVVMQGGDLIPLDRTRPAFDLSVLFNGLRPLIRSTNPEDINIVSREVVKAFDGRSDEVASLFSNLSEVLEMLSSKDAELQTLLVNVTALSQDLTGRDAQLRRTLGNMETFLGELAANRDLIAEALVNLDDAAVRLERLIDANDENIEVILEDLSTILAAVNDKRKELRSAIRGLPEFILAVKRTSNYGEWGNQHLIHVCKDDFGTCGTRGTP